VRSVEVWHTGGGCFNLAVLLDDGRLATPSVAYQDPATGKWWPEAGLPENDGDCWGVVFAASVDAWHEWDEAKLDYGDGGYDDDELVERVRAFAASDQLRVTS
jgi:hypothetical protein